VSDPFKAVFFSGVVLILCVIFPRVGQGTPSAEIAALLSGLASPEPAEVARATAALETLCFEAGRPGAESERKALSLAIADHLGPEVQVEARVLLLRSLETLGKGEVTAVLGRLLSPEHAPVIREGARRALEADPHVKSKRELRKALAFAEGDFLVAIIGSLAARRDFLATAALIAEAEEGDQQVRLAAMDALAEIGDISAMTVFEAALEKMQGADLARVERAYLRLAEALVLNGERGPARRIYGQAMGMRPTVRAAALIGFARAHLQSEVGRIVGMLDDPDLRVRRAACEAAAILPGKKMTRALLVKLARSEAPPRRRELLDILSRRGVKEPESEAPAK
jgi:HEAT repeat protein